MSLSTRLARNSLWLLIARVGAQASLVAITYLLARRLGPTGFGEYAFLAMFIALGNTVTTFGSDMLLIREIAAESDVSRSWSVLVLQLILSCLFVTAVFLFVRYLPGQTDESVIALKIYSLALFPLAFFTVFTSVLRGMQKMISYAWLNFLLPGILLAAIYLFIPAGTSLVDIAYVLLGVQLVGAMLSCALCIPSFPLLWRSFRFSSIQLGQLLIICLPIALIAIVGIVFQKLSLALLAVLGTASMVGLYSAAARVVEAARLGHIALFTALYPAMANAVHDPSSQKTFRSSWLVLLGLTTAGSILLASLGGPIVRIFFGEAFQDSIPILAILAFTLIPYTVSSFLSLGLLARKKEHIVFAVMAVSLLVLLSTNLLVIPRAGAMGASWSTLIAETTQAIIFLLLWLRDPAFQLHTLEAKGASHELPDLS